MKTARTTSNFLIKMSTILLVFAILATITNSVSCGNGRVDQPPRRPGSGHPGPMEKRHTLPVPCSKPTQIRDSQGRCRTVVGSPNYWVMAWKLWRFWYRSSVSATCNFDVCFSQWKYIIEFCHYVIFIRFFFNKNNTKESFSWNKNAGKQRASEVFVLRVFILAIFCLKFVVNICRTRIFALVEKAKNLGLLVD